MLIRKLRLGGVSSLMFEYEERDRIRKNYQICRMGFGILSFALILASLTSVLATTYQFTHLDLIRRFFTSSFYRWIDTPIIWGSLLGVTLLWGRWESSSWQRRAGLLLVMCLVDVVLWVMDQGSDLKLINRDFGHEWLRWKLGQALGWAELALLSTLACDYLVHLGAGYVRETAQSTRSLITTGAMIWMLLFCTQTNWQEGWPLQPGGAMRNPEGLLLTMGVVMIQTVVLIQVTALTMLATRQSTRILEDLDRNDPFHDFLNPRADSRAQERQEFASASSRTRDDW
jgi:hypothetical protein